MTVIWCMVPEIWSATDRIFCHSGPFFALLPPYGPRKSKFWKNEKHTWRYYHFTHVYHKWQSYDVWFLRYGACDRQNFLSFWTVFCPFIPLTAQKTKTLKNWKKDLKILPFYMCSINDNHVMYGSWAIECDRQKFLSFWTMFALLSP